MGTAPSYFTHLLRILVKSLTRDGNNHSGTQGSTKVSLLSGQNVSRGKAGASGLDKAALHTRLSPGSTQGTKTALRAAAAAAPPAASPGWSLPQAGWSHACSE